MRLNLRGKILAYVALPIVALLGVLQIWSAVRDARTQIVVRERALVQREAAELDARLREVAQIAKHTANYLELNPGIDRTALFGLVRRNVAADEGRLVYGAAIAFAPGVSSEGRLFAPYAFRGRGREPEVMDIAKDGYDYTLPQWQWWHRPFKAGHGLWTDVYEDTGAGNTKMVTFSAPFRRDGRVVGVATVDVQLPTLRERVIDAEAAQHKMFVIGADERMVFAHDSEDIGTPLAAIAQRLNRPDILELGRSILRDAPGDARARGWDTTERQWLFFAPVHSPNWVLGLRVDESAVLAAARPGIWRAVALAAVVLAALVLGVTLVATRITRPVARLSRSFTDMAQALIEREQALVAETAAREKIETELALAKELQRSMLPPAEAHDAAFGRYDIAAALEPARAVGGDFFDYVVTPDGRLVFVVADVSDKGVPAALFMVRAHTLMRSLAPRLASPSELLAAMNDALCADNERCMFVTLVCGALELSDGRLALASAGHEPALLLRGDGSLAWLEVDNGPALGLIEGTPYPLAEHRLAPGDALLLYTDGVSEAFDREQRAFGREGLEAAAQARAQAAALDLCAGVFSEVRRFAAGAEQSDDITLLVVRWHGGKA
jgi:sigma-B regulation protein RsbU (phosphoserine phosphatase)